MTCYHLRKGECPHLFINGEDKGPADAMLFAVRAFDQKVREGLKTKEQRVAEFSEPGRTYEIRYLPE